MQHQDFFKQLPFVMLGIVDERGYPWSMPVFGAPGFVRATSSRRLQLQAMPALINALGLDFTLQQKIGMLGIELHTRRRNRLNGTIAAIDAAGFLIDVEQSFGNCPQYIQARELAFARQDAVAAEGSYDGATQSVNGNGVTSRLGASDVLMLEQADTFFIASRTEHFSNDLRTGIDVSHRGGKPGFVQVETGVADADRLRFPDFSGNRFFNTLGNIESDGRVGVFVPDYATGDAVFIAGRAQILWDDPAISQIEGAERIIEITIDHALSVQRFMPLTGELIAYSPVLNNTGTWRDSVQPPQQDYTLVKKHHESEAVTSFYLVPAASSETTATVETYIPGQFLPLQLDIPGQAKTQHRTYTLSAAPGAPHYRISIKREGQGLVSRYLHDEFQVGDVITASAPAGEFVVQDNERDLVLLSSGVGITPMIAMLEGLVNEVERGAKPRTVVFVHSTRNSRTHAFAGRIAELARQYDWIQVHTLYSRPLDSDVLGDAHQSEGRLSIDQLQALLPDKPYDVYLCGSEGFMRTFYQGLIEVGVSKQHIFYEFFGDGSIEESTNPTIAFLPAATEANISFSTAGIKAIWTEADGTLLEFAEKNGLTPLYGCRSGSCGSCACKLISGQVSYQSTPGYAVADDEVLVCSARPADGSDEVVVGL